jgi:hypothetical protein
VQVPAHPLLHAPLLVDEVVAVIDEPLQLTQPLLTLAPVVEPQLRRAALATASRADDDSESGNVP